MLYLYEYNDDIPRDFPTIGKRDVKKGDQISSEEPLFSQFLTDITPPPSVDEQPKKPTKGSDT